MSTLNFLEKLLDGVAVEWKLLREVAKIQRGKRLVKSELEEFGNYAVFQNCMTPLGYYHESNVKSDTTFIISAGAAGEIGYSGVDFWAADDVYYFLTPENLNSKYLYYFLLTQQTKILGQVRRASVPRLSRTAFEKIPIPIPYPDNPDRSLAIQTEIVRILDTFTALTAELTTELTDRKKQYNYYRDRLLTFEKGEVEWKALGEVCSLISAGGDLPKNFAKGQVDPTDEFPYPIYANATGDNGLYGFTDGYKIESDAVTISARGAKIGYHAVREGKFTTIIRLITLVPNKNVVLTKYLNYILDMTPIGGTDGGIPQLTVPTVKKISIPLPPLAEQARIVSILDKFDTLTHSISDGLPREIALRQKQYEYYRDLLLTFPKSKEEP